jgi:hypothetical protein
MFEGIIDDIIHGHIPNIFAERGMKADWKYNRKELVRNVVIAATVTTVLIAFVKRRKK